MVLDERAIVVGDFSSSAPIPYPMTIGTTDIAITIGRIEKVGRIGEIDRIGIIGEIGGVVVFSELGIIVRAGSEIDRVDRIRDEFAPEELPV